jgi:hypothetical protein
MQAMIDIAAQGNVHANKLAMDNSMSHLFDFIIKLIKSVTIQVN